MIVHLITFDRIFNRAHRKAMFHHVNIHKTKMHRLTTSLYHHKKLIKTRSQIIECSKKLRKLHSKNITFDNSNVVDNFERNLLFQHEFQKRYFDRRIKKTTMNVKFDLMMTNEKMFIFVLKRNELLNLTSSIIENFFSIDKEREYNEKFQKKLKNLLYRYQRSLQNFNFIVVLTICIRKHIRCL